MSTTMQTTGGQIPGPSRRERRCARIANFVKAQATAWVIRKTGHQAEKVEVSRGPLKRSDCKRVTLSAHGWKSRGSVEAGEISLSGREAATLLVCFGIPTICKVGGVGKGRRPSTAVIPRPKLSKRVLPQGESRRERRRGLRYSWVAGLRRRLRREYVPPVAPRKEPIIELDPGVLSPHVREYLRPDEAEAKRKKEDKEREVAARRAKVTRVLKPQEPVAVVRHRPVFKADGRTRAKRGFKEMMAQKPTWVEESDWKARLISRGYSAAENSEDP